MIQKNAKSLIKLTIDLQNVLAFFNQNLKAHKKKMCEGRLVYKLRPEELNKYIPCLHWY